MSRIPYISGSISVPHFIFSGGLNSTAGALSLQETESSDLQNVDFDVFGSVKKRNGYNCLNTSAVAGTAQGLYWYVTGTTRKQIAVINEKVYRMDDLDGTWDDISGTAVTLTTGGNYPVSWETFLSTVIWTNDIDVPFKWANSGSISALDVPSGLTRAKFVHKFQNYCMLANCVVSGTDRPNRFYWSALKSITTWGAADFVDISPDDGEEITGFKTLGEKLIVYKTQSIYGVSFTGDANIPFIVQKCDSHVGCIAPYSIQEASNGHIFLAYDGLYYFDGNNSYKMSDKLNNTLKNYQKTRFPYAQSMYQKMKNRYWLSISSASLTINDRVITYDTLNNAFSNYQNMFPAAMSIFLVGGVDERAYFFDYKGYCYWADNTCAGNDDYPTNSKTAINAYYYTGWKKYEDICSQKSVPHTYIYHKNEDATLTFAYSYDYSTTDDYTNTFSTYSTGSVGGLITRQDLDGRGRLIRFKFANARTTETFQIDGIGAMVKLETDT